MRSEKLSFAGHAGGQLAARLDLPDQVIRGYALFAHCFTCSKDLMAVRRIAAGLTRFGIAVLRFDFTGLGTSEGEFASTNFSSNVEDLRRAAEHLTMRYGKPKLLIGHSLGGAAVLAAAGEIPGVEAVITIGAPSDVAHVLHNLGSDLAEIEEKGSASVLLHRRAFTIERQFVEDVRSVKLLKKIEDLRKPLLILHAPLDETVGIEHASKIFAAAKHPKSYVSLSGADHLLTRAEDAEFAADIIAGWSSRFLTDVPPEVSSDASEAVVTIETGNGKFQNKVAARGYQFHADQPVDRGGDGTGPTAYDFLAISLATCTSMTLRSWAEKRGLDLDKISVKVAHYKVQADDLEQRAQHDRLAAVTVDRFERHISINGGVSNQLAADLLRVADECPVHRTLEATSVIKTDIIG